MTEGHGNTYNLIWSIVSPSLILEDRFAYLEVENVQRCDYTITIDTVL